MYKPSNTIQEALDSVDKLCILLEVKDMIHLGQIVGTYYSDTLKCHGRRFATSQLKALYNEACYFVVGQDIKTDTPMWIKRNRKSKLPKLLTPFKPYLLSKVNIRRRVALSYLRVFESNILEPVPDFSTITSPSSGSEGFRTFSSEYEYFLKNTFFGWSLQKLYRDECSKSLAANRQFHYTTKMGIAGPTVGNAGKQSLAVDENSLEILCTIDKSFKSRDFATLLKDNQEFYINHDDIVPGKKLVEESLCRLSFLPDKGGKTRLIAIGNYWVQEVLIGLHDVLYGMLRRLEQDGTYEQASASDAVCNATLKNKVWSYDLTAATDRFPIQPQQVLLSFLDHNLDRWSELLTSMECYYEGKLYTYSVGQPMGFYSSWATFALCHHSIIQFCAFKEGYKGHFKKYRVLGDDVAIWDCKVAVRYKAILQLLDVTISDSKSIVPENQIRPGNSAEFAKRIFYNGKEFSAIPPNVCVMAKRTLWSIPQLLEHLSLRQIDVGGIPVSRIKDVYNLTNKQTLNLCRCLHIWNVVGRNLVSTKSLSPYIPEFVSMVDYKAVVSVRYFILRETMDLCFYALMFAEFEIREELENSFGYQVPANACFLLIMNSRIQYLFKVCRKMSSDLISSDKFSEIVFRSKNDDPIKITDLEFLPILSFGEIKAELTDRIPRKIRFSKYLANLVARVDKIVNENLLGPYHGVPEKG